MNQKERIELLKTSYLCHGLNEEQIAHLSSESEERGFEKQEYIIREGDEDRTVFLLIAGKVRITKKDPHSGEEREITVQEAGEIIGELSLIDSSPRSASVQAVEKSELLALPFNAFGNFKDQNLSFAQVIKNVSEKLAIRIRHMNEFAVKALEIELAAANVHAEVGRFLFIILSVLAGFVFLAGFLHQYQSKVKTSSIVSIPAIIAMMGVSLYQIKKSSFPKSFYGLTLVNWKEHLWEAILYSLPCLVLATLGKWFLIHFVPAFSHLTLFNLSLSIEGALLPLLYMLLCPVQELVTRGTLQSCIKIALSGTHSTFWSILLSNLIFGAIHIILSPMFSLASFAMGCFWGWLFHRQKSLVGCAASHMLIGGWGLSVLGYGPIFRGIS
jgi:CRP-like cAMP-binding protein